LAQRGARTSASQYLASILWLQVWTRRVARWWSEEKFDLLLTPTLAEPPPPLGTLIASKDNPTRVWQRVADLIQFTPQYNATGQPAMSLIECATEVFIDQGYRRTQMSDIASALGVAKGTLYLYVDSEEALFDLVARYADDPRALPKPAKLPVATPRPGATVRYIRERLSRNQVPGTLVAALGARRVDDAGAELSAIAGELFDTLAANRRGIKLLDRSARDLPELAALWFQGARAGLIQALQSYLDDRVCRGLLRAISHR
jgi:AcrR family transcriptional regulator